MAVSDRIMYDVVVVVVAPVAPFDVGAEAVPVCGADVMTVTS